MQSIITRFSIVNARGGSVSQDIETFHDVVKGRGSFATASSEGLRDRVEKSTMVAFLAEHGFVHG